MNAHYELAQTLENFEQTLIALDKITNVKKWQQTDKYADGLLRQIHELQKDIEDGVNIYCEECGQEFDVDDCGDVGMCEDCRADFWMY